MIAATSVDTGLQSAAAELDANPLRKLDQSEVVLNNAQANNFNSHAQLNEAESDLAKAEARQVDVETAILVDDHTAEYAGKAFVFAQWYWQYGIVVLLIGAAFLFYGGYKFRKSFETTTTIHE